MEADFTGPYDYWATKGAGKNALPYYTCWEIWCSRNNMLFNGGSWDSNRIYTHMLEWLQINPIPDKVDKDLSYRLRPHCIRIPALFFDGAQQDGICGCGAWLKLEAEEHFHIIWNESQGSNNKAEIMGLWSELLVAHHPGLPSIDIYGDSQLVIGGISGRTNLRVSSLSGWVDRTLYVLSQFQRASLHHIYRELNERADKLSKLGLEHNFGHITVIHFRDNRERASFRFDL